MKYLKPLLLLLIIAFSATSCFEDADDNVILNGNNLEIQDFVWKGMNLFYVYKDEIGNLADDRFSTNEEYTTYLNSFSNPEDLFASLLYLPDNVDEFSAITSNYLELEQQLQGTNLDSGMKFGLVRIGNSNNVFGYVRYVLPNSSASANGVQRGMIFTGVDGTSLTASNFGNLLFGSNTSFTINLADYDDNGTTDNSDDTITPNGNSISLTKETITENPIFRSNVIETNGFKIGYLMYNGFRISDANVIELNNVIGDFNSQNIDELVLDLRYNGGGSVSTAIWLSSMLTGQFENQLFFEEKWNSGFQAFFEENSPESLINNFVSNAIKTNSSGDETFNLPLNNLNLTKLYVLTTRSTASASELVINGLRPYIDVVQIGVDTRGKPQASTTIYDSEDFSRNNVNASHTYAMQPLIYESANVDGFFQYYDGLSASAGFELSENFGNLGILGDENEPLLERAIMDITGNGRFLDSFENDYFKPIPDESFLPPFSTDMFDYRVKLNR
ncbi:S41 family peptidase [Winogradskyella litorisediminis]|uniref:S41 family peptidase n=1 Tax=Winogradskyella litorisediminis TaxID=1156618 RepID=A0ABW3N9N1_9FLAO